MPKSSREKEGNRKLSAQGGSGRNRRPPEVPKGHQKDQPIAHVRRDPKTCDGKVVIEIGTQLSINRPSLSRGRDESSDPALRTITPASQHHPTESSAISNKEGSETVKLKTKKGSERSEKRQMKKPETPKTNDNTSGKRRTKAAGSRAPPRPEELASQTAVEWAGFGITDAGAAGPVVSSIRVPVVEPIALQNADEKHKPPVQVLSGLAGDRRAAILPASDSGTSGVTESGTESGVKRRIFFVRSGERMDRIFPEWLSLCFSGEGLYIPYDMNQPCDLPEREKGPHEYYADAPLTEIGGLTSQMVGIAMRDRGIQPTRIYSSPSLRSIQTAQGLKKIINPGLITVVEPGLFDWVKYYEQLPHFLSPQRLQEIGFAIDADYQPIMTIEKLAERKEESITSLYARLADVTKEIVRREGYNTDIIIVAHAVNLDAGPAGLLGRTNIELTNGQYLRLGLHYPYCSCVALDEIDGAWRILHNALPSISYLDYSNRINQPPFNMAPRGLVHGQKTKLRSPGKRAGLVKA